MGELSRHLEAPPYAHVVEQVRVAALALHRKGEKADTISLRRAGVRASTQVLHWALDDLVQGGQLPPECRHPTRKKYMDPLPTPLETAHREARAPTPPAIEGVWKYARRNYWTRKRRSWYRRTSK